MNHQINWLRASNVQKIFDLLSQNGGEGRIVGGAVRDHLLNVPIGDVDFCSTRTPQQLIEIVKQHKVRYIETGVKYGTVTLIVGGQNFEVTSLREDVETDGRHAKVRYGTSFKKDAMRRDFTFNALYMNSEGQVFDPLGRGIEDLESKTIKFIGDAQHRIEEDYLRILRYFRFMACYDFKYEESDFNQIAPLVSGLDQLSAERILAEMKRIFQSGYLLNALNLMRESGVVKQIFAQDIKLDDLAYFEQFDFDKPYLWLIKFRLALKNSSASELAKPVKLSNKDTKILAGLDQLSDILQLNGLDLSKLVYLHGLDKVTQNLIYFAAETNFDYLSLQEKLKFVENFEIPVFPIKGADLFDLGFVAGPEMGQKIKQLEAQWLESGFVLSKIELLKAI